MAIPEKKTEGAMTDKEQAIDLGWKALEMRPDPTKVRERKECRCDPETGAVPCEYCALHGALNAGEGACREVRELLEGKAERKTKGVYSRATLVNLLGLGGAENDRLTAENKQLRDRVRSLENERDRWGVLKAKNEQCAREKAFGSPAPRVTAIKVPLADEPAPDPGTDVVFLEMPGWFIKQDHAIGSYLKVVTGDGVYAIKLLPWRD